MGFFAEFNTWLNGVLAQYIATNTAAIARILEPAIVTLGVFYVVVWGYLQLVGKIEARSVSTRGGRSAHATIATGERRRH